MNTISLRIQSAFTLVELMILIAIVSILLTISLPSFTSIIANSEMEEAQENYRTAFQYAKTMARISGSSVTVTIATDPNIISFTLPDGGNVLPDNTTMNPILLPDNISVTASNNTYVFQPNGMISDLSNITLASTRINTINSTLTILNSFGHITVN